MAVAPFIAVAMVLCAYRLTQFFVYDSLIGFSPEAGSKMSDRIDRFAYWPNLNSPLRAETDGPPGSDRSFFRGKLGDLLTCPWCLGFHLSWITYLAFVIPLGAWSGTPLLVHLASVFAVAGAQGFLQSHTG